MQVSEEVAGAAATIMVVLGYGAKEIIRRFKPPAETSEELNEHRSVVIQSMRIEIRRLNRRVDELEAENGALRDDIERLSVKIARYEGRE